MIELSLRCSQQLNPRRVVVIQSERWLLGFSVNLHLENSSFEVAVLTIKRHPHDRRCLFLLKRRTSILSFLACDAFS